MEVHYRAPPGLDATTIGGKPYRPLEWSPIQRTLPIGAQTVTLVLPSEPSARIERPEQVTDAVVNQTGIIVEDDVVKRFDRWVYHPPRDAATGRTGSRSTCRSRTCRPSRSSVRRSTCRSDPSLQAWTGCGRSAGRAGSGETQRLGQGGWGGALGERAEVRLETRVAPGCAGLAGMGHAGPGGRASCIASTHIPTTW